MGHIAYSYAAENWCEFAVGTLVVFLRLYVTTRKRGLRKWQADDYLMLFAWIIFLLAAVVRYEISKRTGIKTGPDTPPALLQEARVGKKYNFAAWILYVTNLWALKGCLLILYSRIVRNLEEHRVVRITAVFLVLTYVGCILECFLHCLPLNWTWISYPVAPEHCRAGIDNFLVVGLLNLLTDLILFAIPVPILLQLRLPWRRKFAIALLLCSGLFTIIATILRNVSAYMLEKGNSDGNWNQNAVQGWAVRENFIALVVVNIPCLKPIVSSAKWIKSMTSGKSSKGGSDGDSGNKTGPESATSTSRSSFFRRYSSRTLQTFGLTTVGVGDTIYEREEGPREKSKEPEVSSISVPVATYKPKPPSAGTGNGFSEDLEATGQTQVHRSSDVTMAMIEREVEQSGIVGVIPPSPTPSTHRVKHLKET